MSDGPSDCARMEERAKREAVEEGYIWNNLTRKEQSDWMFWNKRPEKKEKIIHSHTTQCANCKYYNSIDHVCDCTQSDRYGYKITNAANSPSVCDHYSYNCTSSSIKPYKRKLLLIEAAPK